MTQLTSSLKLAVKNGDNAGVNKLADQLAAAGVPADQITRIIKGSM